MAQPDATKLTPQQERAAEMLAAGQRVARVSRALRIDRATLWRWTKLPAFQETLETLRAIARRDVAEKMQRNVLAAAEALGAILDDPGASYRDRINAARAVLAVSPSFASESPKPEATPSASDWVEIALDTARRASALASHGLSIMLAQTPGAAWKESGLEHAFPGSFARIRALADQPVELHAECERTLAAFRDRLDARAIPGCAQ